MIGIFNGFNKAMRQTTDRKLKRSLESQKMVLVNLATLVAILEISETL